MDTLIQGPLNLTALPTLPVAVARPGFNPSRLGVGIVHFGLGAFHRAHQAFYTDDAIAAAGGDWGILGVALHGTQVAEAVNRQEGLYTIETLQDARRYRVVGALRGALAAPREPARLLDALAAPTTHVVTLTVTEKGYGRAVDGGLDIADPEIASDLVSAGAPRSTLGWLARGLAGRRQAGGGGLTVLSCDNLMANGATLRDLLLAFADRIDPTLACWIDETTRFPNCMVDSITPASDASLQERVSAALGRTDEACVQREPFTQWVIEDSFAGPRPAWETVGVELVDDVAHSQRLKLHVLNTANSALAYLGLLRGFEFAHEAFADRKIAAFVDELIRVEIAAAFPELPIEAYWRVTQPRLANPNVRHALRQIGEDGSAKLAQRVFGPLRANLRAGRPHWRLACLVRSWLEVARRGLVRDPCAVDLQAARNLAAVLATPGLLPDDFRNDPGVRAALTAGPLTTDDPFPIEPFSSCEGVTQ